MAFGLNNAMGTFTRTTIEVFKNWNNKYFKYFIDDVNMHNKFYKDHLSHLRNVLSKLWKVNLNLNLGCVPLEEGKL
jgi:hypothetical protein